jgi:hypothetical protein
MAASIADQAEVLWELPWVAGSVVILEAMSIRMRP